MTYYSLLHAGDHLSMAFSTNNAIELLRDGTSLPSNVAATEGAQKRLGWLLYF